MPVKAVLSCASLAAKMPQDSSCENHAGEAPLQAGEPDLCSRAHEELHEDILSSVLFSCPNPLWNHRRDSFAVGDKAVLPVYIGDLLLWKDFYYGRCFSGCAAHIVLCKFLKERLDS